LGWGWGFEEKNRRMVFSSVVLICFTRGKKKENYKTNLRWCPIMDSTFGVIIVVDIKRI